MGPDLEYVIKPYIAFSLFTTGLIQRQCNLFQNWLLPLST